MIVPFFIYSASTGAPLAGVVPTFTVYNRTESDATVTDLSASKPTISDKGGGLYEFTIPDATFLAGSIVNYVIDCTTAATARYIEDHLRSDAVLALDTTTSTSTLNLFGVTADSVRRHMFPQWPSFSTKSNPTAVTVSEMIDEVAADLEGELALRSVASTGITDTAKAAYKWCAQVVKLGVAIKIAPAVTGLDPAVVQRWKKEYLQRLDALEKRGVTVLGAGATATESAEDPLEATTFISEYSLDVTASTDMSTAQIALHKDDEL